MSSSNVTLHGKDYSSGNIVPIAVNNAGELIISTEEAISLSNLSDIQFTGLSNNQVIAYNSDTSKWLNTSNLELTKLTTQEIQATNGGNLDIQSTAGNINITANHDIILSANAPSTIKLLGLNNQLIAGFSIDSEGNSYVSFGSTTGESGYGIKSTADGNVFIKSQYASEGWSGLSNTTITLGGRTVALGGSNTIGFSDLTGVIDESQISTGTISNDLLAGSISNDKLANTSIIIGNQTITLGSSGDISLSNISDIELTDLNNSNILVYNSSSEKWVNTARNVFTTGLTINGTIDGISTPSTGTQAANKDYVDTIAQGLSLKTSARVATTTDTADLNIGTYLVNGATVDGVTLVTGNRVLIKNQSTGVQNGIYLVLASAGTATRVSDMASGSNSAGVFCFIQEGTQNGDCGFVCSNNTGNDVVGTNDLEFVQFSSAGVIQAGTALEKVGTTLNVLRTSILPIGSIQQYAGLTAPSGWRICNGDQISIVEFNELYSVIGTTYGSGNGTFALPNLQGRIPVGRNDEDTDFVTLGGTGGAKSVALTTAQIPSHQHYIAANESATSGSPWSDQQAVGHHAIVYNVRSGTGSPNYTLVRTANSTTPATLGLSSATGSGSAHNNLQPYIVLNYIIYTGVYS